MKKKINVGIIGRNFGYQVIYKALKNNKYFNVIGFSYKKKLPKLILPQKIKIYKNWRQLVSDRKIKAIFISSPPYTHKEIINFSIKKNKHIFCEKPVTNSLKDITDICKENERKKLVNFVNYEFNHIEAFKIFEKKYFPKIKIKKVFVNWLIKVPNRARSNWKNSHKMGGGNFFNYICHILFYLETFFGKIEICETKLKNLRNKFELRVKILSEDKKTEIDLNFKNIGQKSKLKPYHKIVFKSDKDNFTLFTKINNLFDQFVLYKNNRVIFRPKKIDYDFRLVPTYKNIVSFKKYIEQNKCGNPNFKDAKRIHFLINKIINY